MRRHALLLHVVEPADITTIGLLADGHGSTRLLVDAAGTTEAIYARLWYSGAHG